jgi:zinc transporter ZupT
VTANVWTVFVAALVTALATGVGALPFAFLRGGLSRRAVAGWNIVAAALMLAASASLVYEGALIGAGRTALGAVVGVVFIVAFRRLIGDGDDLVLGSLRGVDARKALVIVAVMTAHSAAEGVGVGVSFGDGKELGLLITVAIAIHNIPEGLAISVVLVPRGASVRSAAWWSIFSSLPQPLLAPLAFLFVEQFHAVLPAGLGFAAGAMLWMVFTELVPEALALRSAPCEPSSARPEPTSMPQPRGSRRISGRRRSSRATASR